MTSFEEGKSTEDALKGEVCNTLVKKISPICVPYEVL